MSARSRSIRRPGSTEIVRYTIVDDFGATVNPMLLAGQVHGGVVQSIGQALLEHTVYDADGQLVTGTFNDYAMPRAGRPAVLRLPDAQRALQVECARHQGRGRGRHDRRDADGDERRRRRAEPRLRHPQHRHAGDAASRLGGDPGREGVSVLRSVEARLQGATRVPGAQGRRTRDVDRAAQMNPARGIALKIASTLVFTLMLGLREARRRPHPAGRDRLRPLVLRADPGRRHAAVAGAAWRVAARPRSRGSMRRRGAVGISCDGLRLHARSASCRCRSDDDRLRRAADGRGAVGDRPAARSCASIAGRRRRSASSASSSSCGRGFTALQRRRVRQGDAFLGATIALFGAFCSAFAVDLRPLDDAHGIDRRRSWSISALIGSVLSLSVAALRLGGPDAAPTRRCWSRSGSSAASARS